MPEYTAVPTDQYGEPIPGLQRQRVDVDGRAEWKIPKEYPFPKRGWGYPKYIDIFGSILYVNDVPLPPEMLGRHYSMGPGDTFVITYDTLRRPDYDNLDIERVKSAAVKQLVSHFGGAEVPWREAVDRVIAEARGVTHGSE